MASDRRVSARVTSVEAVRPPLKLWWILWALAVATLVACRLLIDRVSAGPMTIGQLQRVGLGIMAPLFISIIIRWLMIPRATSVARVFVLFVVGVAMAEASGVVALVLGGGRDEFILGVLGVVQFAPFFAKQPVLLRRAGFIPNN